MNTTTTALADFVSQGWTVESVLSALHKDAGPHGKAELALPLLAEMIVSLQNRIEALERHIEILTVSAVGTELGEKGKWVLVVDTAPRLGEERGHRRYLRIE